MSEYVISLHVQVIVEANSPSEAERLAFERRDELCASKDAHVTAAQFVRQIR